VKAYPPYKPFPCKHSTLRPRLSTERLLAALAEKSGSSSRPVGGKGLGIWGKVQAARVGRSKGLLTAA